MIEFYIRKTLIHRYRKKINVNELSSFVFYLSKYLEIVEPYTKSDDELFVAIRTKYITVTSKALTVHTLLKRATRLIEKNEELTFIQFDVEDTLPLDSWLTTVEGYPIDPTVYFETTRELFDKLMSAMQSSSQLEKEYYYRKLSPLFLSILSLTDALAEVVYAFKKPLHV